MGRNPERPMGRYQAHPAGRFRRGRLSPAMQPLLRYPFAEGTLEHLQGVQRSMTRAQLEHLIRASGAIAEAERLVIIGSQAILGSCPEAPNELLRSMEADLFPADDTGRADLIDGSIGE